MSRAAAIVITSITSFEVFLISFLALCPFIAKVNSEVTLQTVCKRNSAIRSLPS